MSAVFPPLFSSMGCGFADHVSDEQQSNFCKDAETSESYLHVPPSGPIADRNWFAKSTSIGGDLLTAKKLNHNASERDRRKKINNLYSSLGALLPNTDRSKKLSVPATVALVLKYIPELQEQVGELQQRWEDLILKFSTQRGRKPQETQAKTAARKSSSAVSATWPNDGEVVIQITTYKVHKCSLSDILQYLEESRLLLLSASSFESFGRMFYHLHLQVDGTNRLECQFLSENIMSLIEKRE